MMTRFRRFALGLVLFLGLTAAVTDVLPWQSTQPANAWTWSPSVTISGKLNGCGVGAQTANVRGVLNGQYQSYSTPLGQPPSYKLTFTNVPSGTSWAWVVVNCTVTSNYGVWVRMYRPTWGSTISANL
jgi:hypothetical protein